jgi:hypothetical protein
MSLFFKESSTLLPTIATLAAGFVTQNRSKKGLIHDRPDKMMNPAANMETRRDEELERALAVLAYASGEVLNETEVRIFYQLYEETRRRSAVTAA